LEKKQVMELYLIRHAEAVAVGEGGIIRDADRPLTDAGRTKARTLAAALQKQQVRFDAVISSPLVRAKQTTDEMLAGLGEPKLSPRVFDEIGFEVRPKVIVQYLQELKVESVAIVGHQPGLARFAAWLIGSKKARLDLAKAGLAHIDCHELEKGGGTLISLLTPEWYTV
jgi:phosphohistidine phosphatase